MSIARTLAALSLAASAFAFMGCAADTSVEEETANDSADADDVGTNEEALTGTAKRFAGTWIDGTATGPNFNMYYSKLVFGADGRYTGEIADPRIRCVRAPCVLQDSGTWNGYTYRGELRLRLTSPRYGRKIYDARIVSAQSSLNVLPPENLTLSRNGTTVSLAKERVAGCLVVKCSAGYTCDDAGRTKNGTCVPNVTCANVRCAAGTRCEDANGTQTAQCVSQAACRKTGCSSQLCADSDMMTTCEFRAEYACYQTAVCERGTDGQCGFRKTAALTSCLAAPPGL
jgi:hypothetical protein